MLDPSIANQYAGIYSIVVSARRWFDKINGNTYHSVEVWVNHKYIGKIPYAYGYGDQYRQSAWELLQKEGIIPKSGKELHNTGADLDIYNFRMWLQEEINRNKLIVICTDVQRKKDL